MISPESDCRCGSFSTSVHISVSHWAVISLISLCLAIGSPPEGHVMAWSVEKVFHTYSGGVRFSSVIHIVN